ncbi:MAG: phospholipase C/P1 nuclease family protein [Sulfuricaulis sp.]
MKIISKKLIATWIFLHVLSVSSGIYAYEVGTHSEMSNAAYDKSVLSKPDFLKTLGISATDVFDESRADPRPPMFNRGNARGWIQEGAVSEDDTATLKRPLNHFFDPLRNQPLRPYGLPLFVNDTSPDWALEDNGKIGKQKYSFRDARDFLYKALTLPDPKKRDKNFGLTFQTLGQVIHHIQDMAQPQHVRNDAHLDQPKEFDILGLTIPNPLYNPSLYEKYTQGRGGNLPFSGYPPVTFTKARDYWTGGINGNGQGLADFTNANFLSAGTNFEPGTNGQPVKNSRYDLPEWNGTTESVTFWDLLKKEGIDCTAATGTPASTPPSLTVAIIIVPPPSTVPDLPPACQLNGEMVFYGTTVTDNYLGTPGVNNSRASTLSVFDQDLEKNNLPLTFSLNRFNFEYAYPHLIPKAVSYSAGLIDYFFRGKLEIQSINDDGNQLTIEVKNNSGADNLFKSGDFSFYYDDIDGARVPLTLTQNAKLTGPLAHNAVLTLTANKPKLSRVDPTKDEPLLLVFKGVIGQEEGVAATVIEMPLSGFVVIPGYPPADGIVGPRHLFREDGQWMLSKRAGVAAGNIDWKGWYVNGRPSRVLTWWGPQGRYFPNNSTNGSVVDNSGPQIYQNGAVFALAPSAVLGAAMTKDASGKEWLVAICREGLEDAVYRRPNKKNDVSSEIYDPVTNPDGWEAIGRFIPSTGMLAPDRPWFFNGTGTEAQTMRRDNRVIQNGVTRLKIKITANGATLHGDFVEEGNLEGQKTITNDGGQATRVVPPAPSCSGYTSSIDQKISSSDITQGSYVVAVDYQDLNEVLATLTLTASRSADGTYFEVHTRTAYCDANGNIIETGGSDTITESGKLNSDYLLALKFSNLNLPLITNTYAREENLKFDKEYSFSGSLSDDQFYRSLYYLDLRYDLIVLQTDHDTGNGSCTGEPGDIINMTSAAKFEILQSGKTIAVYDATRSFSGSFVRCFTGNLPNGLGNRDPSTSVSSPLPIIFQSIPVLGSWSVDSEDNLFISQQYDNQVEYKLSILNHLDGAPNDDPALLIPTAPADAVYFPVGVIR